MPSAKWESCFLCLCGSVSLFCGFVGLWPLVSLCFWLCRFCLLSLFFCCLCRCCFVVAVVAVCFFVFVVAVVAVCRCCFVVAVVAGCCLFCLCCCWCFNPLTEYMRSAPYFCRWRLPAYVTSTSASGPQSSVGASDGSRRLRVVILFGARKGCILLLAILTTQIGERRQHYLKRLL